MTLVCFSTKKCLVCYIVFVFLSYKQALCIGSILQYNSYGIKKINAKAVLFCDPGDPGLAGGACNCSRTDFVGQRDASDRRLDVK